LGQRQRRETNAAGHRMTLHKPNDRLDEVDDRLAVDMLFHDSGTYQRNDDRQGAEPQSHSS
jgi:hypothetical protein